MQMRPWASGWQRIWCSIPRRQSAILAGIRGVFIRDLKIKMDGLREPAYSQRGHVDGRERLNQEPSQLPLASPKVVILLATRNGAEFLQEQLESYRAQTHSNWELLVSDDGSTDRTVEISMVRRTASRNGWLFGRAATGFWQNFVSLVRSDDIAGDLFAYSDQDDIWFPEKLAKAVEWFRALSDRSAGIVLYPDRTDRRRRLAGGIFTVVQACAGRFRMRLVQNIGGGNTMVFNLCGIGGLARDAGRCRIDLARLVDVSGCDGRWGSGAL